MAENFSHSYIALEDLTGSWCTKGSLMEAVSNLLAEDPPKIVFSPRHVHDMVTTTWAQQFLFLPADSDQVAPLTKKECFLLYDVRHPLDRYNFYTTCPPYTLKWGAALSVGDTVLAKLPPREKRGSIPAVGQEVYASAVIRCIGELYHGTKFGVEIKDQQYYGCGNSNGGRDFTCEENCGLFLSIFDIKPPNEALQDHLQQVMRALKEKKEESRQNFKSMKMLGEALRQLGINSEEVLEGRNVSQKGNTVATRVYDGMMEKRATIAKLERKVKERENTVMELQNEVAQKESTVKRLQAEMKEKEDSITKLQGKVREEENAGVMELRDEVRQKESTISVLQGEVRDKESTVSRLQGELEEKASTISRLQAVVRERVTRVREEMRERDRRVTTLQAELREKEEQLVRQRESHATEVRRLRQEAEQYQHQFREEQAQHQQLMVDKGETMSSQALDLWDLPRKEVHISHTILGTGGWGYVAKGTFRGQAVAVKCLHRGILSPRNESRLRREISIMSQVRHPNLLLLIGAVLTAEGTGPLIITELLDRSLRSAYEEGVLEERSKVPVLRDVASALTYLHSHRTPIIHRDVSSANVLLETTRRDSQWKAKLSDFGSANLCHLATTPAEGSAVYSAPEVSTEDRSRQTAKIDVYSFGVLVCEVCLCQFPPERREFPSMLGELRLKAPKIFPLSRDCTSCAHQDRPAMRDVLQRIDQLIS